MTDTTSATVLLLLQTCQGYGAAKAGLLGLTHSQAASLAPKGVRVNAICPGWIDTSGEAAGASSITQEQHECHWTGRIALPDTGY